MPVALVIIMLGLGLGLTMDDFARVGRYPKAAVIALVCQLVVLPVMCFGVVLAFGLEPNLAVGLLLLAASPGGPTANLYSHLFGGHVALNVALTAVNSLIVVVTLPIVANLAAGYFLPDSRDVGLQWTEVSQVFVIAVVPVIVGMLLRARLPRVARWLDRPVRVLSIVVLLAVVGAVLAGGWAKLPGYFAAVGLAVLAFNLISLLVGYGVPRLAGVEHRLATAAGFEIGIHNTALTLTVAASPALMNSVEMAIPAAVYGIVMHGTALTFGLLFTRRKVRASAPAEPVPADA
ncbi:bile acid:sodium symporter family protein [Dactylosporangium sp. NPDC051541]|uniref:bile acid:sodium symporter family protein n=1 Tax=Dactylosporangium sp. NPDC051541 TaxID=3363977 RepID=UPI00378B8584